MISLLGICIKARADNAMYVVTRPSRSPARPRDIERRQPPRCVLLRIPEPAPRVHEQRTDFKACARAPDHAAHRKGQLASLARSQDDALIPQHQQGAGQAADFRMQANRLLFIGRFNRRGLRRAQAQVVARARNMGGESRAQQAPNFLLLDGLIHCNTVCLSMSMFVE